MTIEIKDLDLLAEALRTAEQAKQPIAPIRDRIGKITPRLPTRSSA